MPSLPYSLLPTPYSLNHIHRVHLELGADALGGLVGQGAQLSGDGLGVGLEVELCEKLPAVFAPQKPDGGLGGAELEDVLADALRLHPGIHGLLRLPGGALGGLRGPGGEHHPGDHRIDKIYQLAINNGPNHLHGGIVGYAYQIWNVSEYTESSVSFTKVSPDTEEGYPGKVNLKITYTLDDQNTLSIRYEAETDQDTILNLTNHSYWNLNGHDSGDAMNHLLQMPCSYFCPCDSNALVTGEIRSVAGTPFDFRSIHSIGSTVDADDEQLKNGSGFDHCFLLDNSSPIILEGDLTKIRMEITTDMPAVQLYSANHLHEQTGKNNAVYFPRNSVCLETEQVPDAPNNPQFPSCVLKAGEYFSSTTNHKFIY